MMTTIFPVGDWRIFDARSDHLVVEQDSERNELDILSNDSYYDPVWRGDELKIAGVTTAEHGAITLSEDGRTVLYSPTAEFTGLDHFTYSIRNADGVTRDEDVYIHVVQPYVAVPDWFPVRQGSENNILPVLANDQQNYYGQSSHVFPEPTAREDSSELTITGVGTPNRGGTVVISGDGGGLIYTPDTNHEGLESFTYTAVDRYGHSLVATVKVQVTGEDVTASDTNQRYQWREQFEQDWLEQALSVGQFGRPTSAEGGVYWYPGWTEDVISIRPTVFRSAISTATTFSDASLNLQYSTTNTQVAGVDEADLVKTDGDYLYVLSNQTDRNELLIIDTRNPVEPKFLARLPFEEQMIEQYLVGDQLLVISGSTQASGFGYWEPSLQSELHVTLLDISDRADPRIVEETVIEGGLVESRRIGESVYVISRDPRGVPELETVCFDADGGCFQETKAQFIARISERIAQEALPQFETFDAEGQLLRSGLLGDLPELPPSSGSEDVLGDFTFTSIVTFQLGDENQPGPDSSTMLTFGQPSEIYVSTGSIYLFESTYDATEIHKLDIADDGLSVNWVASGSVAGQLLNQFSADEADGYLRIATQSVDRLGGNHLYVLQQSGDELQTVGGINDLAPGERIYAARFMGDTGFLVTFRKVDPLFAIDLSDPANPQVLGQLKVPGFSNYLQLIDENHLLGIGRNADENTGLFQGLQVSLFDVSDLTSPTLVDRYTFEGGRKTWSPVAPDAWNLGDHHAVGYYATHGTLALPIYSEGGWRSGFGDVDNTPIFSSGHQSAVRVLRIDVESGITSLGQVEFDSRATRTVQIGDFLYSISPDAIKVTEMLAPETTVAELFVGQGAADDYAETRSHDTMTIAVMRNDTQPDANQLRTQIAAVAQPEYGQANISSDRTSVEFTPPENFLGRTSFVYSLEGADGHRRDAMVTVDVQYEWHNSEDPLDTNGDSHFSPADVIGVISLLNKWKSAHVDEVQNAMLAAGKQPSFRADVDRDGYLSPRDAMMLIAKFNRHGPVHHVVAAPVGEVAAATNTRQAMEAEPSSVESLDEPLDPRPIYLPFVPNSGDDESYIGNGLARRETNVRLASSIDELFGAVDQIDSLLGSELKDATHVLAVKQR